MVWLLLWQTVAGQVERPRIRFGIVTYILISGINIEIPNVLTTNSRQETANKAGLNRQGESISFGR